MKILYLCPGRARAEREGNLTAGSTPRDFFYGIETLRAAGNDVEIGDTRAAATGPLAALHLRYEIARNSAFNFGTSLQRVRSLAGSLSDSDVAISFTDGFSLSLGRYGRTRAPDTTLVAGFHGISTFVERARHGSGAYMRAQTRRALENLDHIFFFGEADREFAIDHYQLDISRTSIFRFGIDLDFWTPDAGLDEDSRTTVLSVGSDPARDFPTLLAADLNAPLHIATRLPLDVPQGRDIEVFSGSYHGSAITDTVLRSMYCNAAVVAIPVQDVFQPSGYSVSLQAMACGRPIVLTDFRGLWDRDAYVSGENCMLVLPGDPDAMAQAVNDLLADPDRRAAMGQAARRTAEQVFALSRMDEDALGLVTHAANSRNRV
jgi:glycosyltransferase involved in cell wall biosynthesis